ncbi:MAG: DUF4293 domain-containing protein [Paludibacteraceae bacterium]|nr:DUF4293 domain-containing protein [Paludibacteraceae bacterium]
MWQRIQSLYMAVIAILSMVMAFVPVASLMEETSGKTYELKFPGFVAAGEQGETILNMWWIYVLLFAIAIVAVVAFFMYKNRTMQQRLLVFDTVLMVGYYVLFFLGLSSTKSALAELGHETTWHMYFAFCLMLINIVLSVMSIRAIRSDEELVRSVDRLR